MTVVRMEIDGEERFIWRMNALARRVGMPIEVLNRVADDMMRTIKVTFTGQGRRHGGSWKALSSDQRKYKAAHGQDPRILIATGALMHSYTQRGNEHQELSVTPQGITLDSDLTYGAAHQYGNERTPKREFIKFYPEDHARWAKMIRDDLARAYRGGRVR